MKKFILSFFAFALIPFVPATAFAQRGRPPETDWRDRFEARNEVKWADSMENTLASANEKDSFAIIYVFAPSEEELPGIFTSSAEIARTSRDKVAFHQMAFDEENEWIRRWEIRRAPMLVAVDVHGNAFSTSNRITIAQLREMIRTTPGAIRAFQAEIKETAGGLDEEGKKAERAAQDILKTGRWGYVEINDALDFYRDLWAREKSVIDLLEAADPGEAADYVLKLSRSNKGNPLGMLASIKSAWFDSKKRPAAALRTLNQIVDEEEPLLFEAEIKAAGEMIEKVIDRGEEAVTKARDAKDKEEVRRLKKEYAGTRVEAVAEEALKSL